MNRGRFIALCGGLATAGISPATAGFDSLGAPPDKIKK